MEFPKRLQSDQCRKLEAEVTKQEIKTAVWECEILVHTEGVSDPDLLSYAKPRPAPDQDVAQSSRKAVVTEDPDSEKSTSFTSMVGSPGSIYQSWWGVTNNCRLDTLTACQDMVDHIVPPGYFSELRHLPNDEFLNQYNTTLALLEAEVDMKGAAEAKNVERAKELESLRAQIMGEERIKAAFDEFKKYEDDRELYPHMLTVIVGRRWIIGHGLRLAVMKCAESIELRQVFADVVSVEIAKGMSEGRKHGVEHEKVKVELVAIEAYDAEVETKYVTALHALKDLKYPLVDQLKKLKDAPIDVIMASLFLESDSGEDAPQWIRGLHEILLEDAIAANVSHTEKKKKYRVVCRTHRVSSAHHAKSDGVPKSVPTVASQGLAILLADVATQSKIIEDEASPRLIRSKSLLPLYDLDWP
nr:hypothetical protein [Tanacetum cinerariifolium]